MPDAEICASLDAAPAFGGVKGLVGEADEECDVRLVAEIDPELLWPVFGRSGR